jgi:membrane-associated protease RseP (regulator of RpoE activity)
MTLPLSDRSRLHALAVLLCAALAGPAAAEPWPPGVEAMVNPSQGRIGIQVQPMTPELREHFHAPADRGLLVSQVETKRPAALAGIEVGDVLLEGDGQPLTRPFDLVRIVSRAPQGKELEITALRDGVRMTFRVQPEGEDMPWIDPSYWREWVEKGMQMGSEELRRQLHQLDRRLQDLQRRLEKLEEKSAESHGEPT